MHWKGFDYIELKSKALQIKMGYLFQLISKLEMRQIFPEVYFPNIFQSIVKSS